MAAAHIFEDIASYQDAEAKAVYCREQHKETTYQTAIKEIEKNTSASMGKAATLLASISGWRDADAKAEECRQRAQELAKKEKLARKKELIIGASILGVILIALLTVAIYFNTVIAVEKDGVKYRKVDDAYHVVGCENSVSNVTILDEIKEKPVTAIEDRAFYQCENLKNITIPSSITSIGEYAFRGCSGLTSVIIPSSVTSIGTATFAHCTGLTSITIPDSATSIGTSAFEGCSALTSITIPNSVTGIGKYAFYGCTGLTSITIPSSVTSIGERAFSDCSSLTSITIPSSVTSIGTYAFSGCSSLTSITIPSSVTSIGSCAFSQGTKLNAVILNETNGWSVFLNNFHHKDLPSNTLSKPATVADYFKTTYFDYTWTRTP